MQSRCLSSGKPFIQSFKSISRTLEWLKRAGKAPCTLPNSTSEEEAVCSMSFPKPSFWLFGSSSYSLEDEPESTSPTINCSIWLNNPSGGSVVIHFTTTEMCRLLVCFHWKKEINNKAAIWALQCEASRGLAVTARDDRGADPVTCGEGGCGWGGGWVGQSSVTAAN